MPTAPASLRQFLRAGGKSYGPLLISDSPIVAEVLAQAGYGHVVIDHEHSPTDVRSGRALLQAVQSSCSFGARVTEAIVRLPDPHDLNYMKKVLDSLRLPGGVLVPMVENATMATAIVQSTRYPPSGTRGCAAPFVRASRYSHEINYASSLHDLLLVMVQVETPTAIEAIPEIASGDGVDAIFLGPLDLSASIGKLGQFQFKEFLELLIYAEEAVLAYGNCLLAGFRVPGRELEAMFRQGYSLVCGSVDIGLLQEAIRRDVAHADKAIGKLQGNKVGSLYSL